MVLKKRCVLLLDHILHSKTINGCLKPLPSVRNSI